jgi:hypothetical protein
MSFAIHYKGIIDNEKYQDAGNVIKDILFFSEDKGLRTKLASDPEKSGVYIFFNEKCEPIKFIVEEVKTGLSDLLIVNNFSNLDTGNLNETGLMCIEILEELNKKYFNSCLNISDDEEK